MEFDRELEDYERRLLAFRPEDRAAFADLLHDGSRLLDLRPVDLCEQFDVSLPSARRWMDGESAPHPAVRQLVIQHLADRVSAQGARVVSSPMPAIAAG